MNKEKEMRIEVSIKGVSLSSGKEMTGSMYTLTCCLSKLESNPEAVKKQLRVGLECVCSVTKMLLSPSFGAPIVFLWSPYDSSNMVRSEFEDGSKWYATSNTCSSVNEAGLVRVVDLYSRVDESMFVRIR